MISLIWAMDQQRLIGANNNIPWHLPADMAWFRQHTLGKSVLMGRKTFDSIGKPLPKRRNIILSRQQGLHIPGCAVVHNLDDTMTQFANEELMVMGGSEIYALALPHAQRLYCTKIQEKFQGDAWFPDIDMSSWQSTYEAQHMPDAQNKAGYSFHIYQRKSSI